ncbi:ATP-grasp domain-containing protein [Kineosporia sp. NBRC 101731]|uniref:ATP-grasp domain-containing protein n=1 Tax=Kineosporia sp. NBRC 101731 TaxID=3032199 RepID=UPI0024A46848|nr:ATP-grasp domain-containing protein [Kineosporia sp. NBRC 101731]GLY30467.1 carboxylase [Kineosporia sp. NBRC 101731]
MARTQDERPWLIVVASGGRPFREYLFRSIAARYRIHLLDAGEPGWQQPYLEDCTVLPDTGAATVREQTRTIAAGRPVAGVMTWHEEHVLQTALASADLGLPGADPGAAARCRDKFQTRTTLTGLGVRQPRFALAGTLDEARAAATQIGYPVVVKPRALGGSMGVVLVHDEVELAEHFPQTRAMPFRHTPDYERPVLIEEYVTGPEISVDSVVQGGRATPLFVTRKQTGFAPWFEETGHLVEFPSPWQADAGLIREIDRIHRGVGFVDGWTHTEFRLTPSGPVLIEINGRLGGDLIPYLGRLASGIDPGLVAAAVATGRPAPVTPSSAGWAGIRFFYPPEGTVTIKDISIAGEGLPEGTDLLTPLVEAGDVVDAARNTRLDRRIGLATALAATQEECVAALDAAGAALRVTPYVTNNRL